MLRIILLTLVFMPCLYAAECQQTYKPALTTQLQEIYRKTKSINFREYRGEIKRLIEQGANPNIYLHGFSLLSTIVLRRDEDLARCSLAHGANPNPPEGELPLFCAQDVPIVKCLIEHKADVNVIMNDNLLHNAITQSRSVAIFGIFLNVGVDPNQKNRFGYSLLHALFFHSEGRIERLLKAAILLWGGANPNEKDSDGKTPFDLLEKDEPFLVAPMLAIVFAMPKIRAEKELPYIKSLPEYAEVVKYMPDTLTNLVLVYAMIIPWEAKYWDEIKVAIPQWLEILKKAAEADSEVWDKAAGSKK